MKLIPSSLKGEVFFRIERVLYFLSAILGIIVPIIVYSRSSDPNTPTLVAIITLALLAFTFAALFIIEEWRMASKARYAEAMSSLHLCIHILRDIYFGFKDPKVTDSNRRSDLSMALWSLARCFSVLKGVHCRTCIKLIDFDEDIFSKDNTHLDDEERLKYLYVSTFSRDKETELKNDYIPNGNSKEHTISGNTDFRELYLMTPGSQRFWACNDLRKADSSYQNTRYLKVSDSKALGYRSALIVPIRKMTSGLFYEKQKSCKQDILGFLCIDSKTRGIFNDRYDPELSSAFADVLYILLKSWFKIADKETNNGKQNKESQSLAV